MLHARKPIIKFTFSKILRHSAGENHCDDYAVTGIFKREKRRYFTLNSELGKIIGIIEHDHFQQFVQINNVHF